MAVLFCVRHGQASIFSDNYDQLSEKGQLQAEKLGVFFKENDIRFDKVFYGPLQRQRHTKDLILQHAIHDSTQVIEMPELHEHEGYTTMKRILPDIIDQDAGLRDLMNRPWDNTIDQVRHHMRVYEYFSHNWIKGKYADNTPDDLQSWSSFLEACSVALDKISSSISKGEKVLAVTSAGPVAAMTGSVLGLTPSKILEQSWIVYNSSISEILITPERKTVSVFNHISHLRGTDLRTLV